MQEARRCRKCNTLNDSGKLYCTRCGKYLSDKLPDDAKLPVIWDIRREKAGVLPGEKEPEESERYKVYCPECGCSFPVAGGVMPLACEKCGYFFQMGIDKVISEKDEAEALKPEKRKEKPAAGDHKKRTPLKRVKPDTSVMRLIPADRRAGAPETVRYEGDVLGVNGTVLRWLRSSEQISFRHSPAGWYAVTLSGEPLYNGVPKNAGVQVRLRDGDVIIAGGQQIYVEIVDPE